MEELCRELGDRGRGKHACQFDARCSQQKRQSADFVSALRASSQDQSAVDVVSAVLEYGLQVLEADAIVSSRHTRKVIDVVCERTESKLQTMSADDDGEHQNQLLSSCAEGDLYCLCDALCAVEALDASKINDDSGSSKIVQAALDALAACTDVVISAKHTLRSSKQQDRMRSLGALEALPCCILDVACKAEVAAASAAIQLLGVAYECAERLLASSCIFTLVFRNCMDCGTHEVLFSDDLICAFTLAHEQLNTSALDGVEGFRLAGSLQGNYLLTVQFLGMGKDVSEQEMAANAMTKSLKGAIQHAKLPPGRAKELGSVALTILRDEAIGDVVACGIAFILGIYAAYDSTSKAVWTPAIATSILALQHRICPPRPPAAWWIENCKAASMQIAFLTGPLYYLSRCLQNKALSPSVADQVRVSLH